MRIISLLILMFSINLYAQELPGGMGYNRKIIEINVKKTGPYLGIQRGEYTVLEIGGERQWKQVRFRSPKTHAAHMGFNYNFKCNVLGYDIGYWLKPHRIGLTYGANIFYRTDFISSGLGLAPVIGFKFMWFHLQTGCHFMSRPKSGFETNTFFISLRAGLINDRDVKIKRDKFDFEK